MRGDSDADHPVIEIRSGQGSNPSFFESGVYDSSIDMINVVSEDFQQPSHNLVLEEVDFF